MNRKRSVARANQPRKQIPTIPSEITDQEWRAGIAHLAQDLSHVQDKPRHTAKIHTQVQDALSLYITAQQQGQDAAILYPEIAAHLRVCRECRTHYELTRALVESLAQSQPVARATNPTALSRPTLWRKVEFPASHAQSNKVRFIFNPKQLRAASLQAPATRSANQALSHLLLHDQFSFAGQSGVVQAWIYPLLDAPDTTELEIILDAPRKLLAQLRVSLASGKQNIPGRTTREKTTFRFPRTPFKNFSLELEYSPPNRMPAPKPRSKKK